MTNKQKTLNRLRIAPATGPDLLNNGDWRYTDSIHKLIKEGYDIAALPICGKRYKRYVLVSEPTVTPAGMVERAKQKAVKVWTAPVGPLGLQMLVRKGELKSADS